MVRYDRALSPTDVLTTKRALGAQNYSFRNYGRALRGQKRFFFRFRNIGFTRTFRLCVCGWGANFCLAKFEVIFSGDV